MGILEITTLSIVGASLFLVLFTAGKVQQLEKRIKELEDKSNEN